MAWLHKWSEAPRLASMSAALLPVQSARMILPSPAAEKGRWVETLRTVMLSTPKSAAASQKMRHASPQWAPSDVKAPGPSP